MVLILSLVEFVDAAEAEVGENECTEIKWKHFILNIVMWNALVFFKIILVEYCKKYSMNVRNTPSVNSHVSPTISAVSAWWIVAERRSQTAYGAGETGHKHTAGSDRRNPSQHLALADARVSDEQLVNVASHSKLRRWVWNYRARG